MANSMNKKLSVAFIWHMHQPTYKDRLSEEYLMPWVRLHAIKDYLDMLLILDEFPNIRQTFNLVPSLIDQLYDYGYNNAQDKNSKLTISDVSKLTVEDKVFILEHFFDANYTNMIFPHEPYRKLYEKRYQQGTLTTDSFSDQEYADIMAWFNLVWFDPYWTERNEEIRNFYRKGENYTQEDRIRIVEIQREIIKNIIPKYKEFFDNGRIEISTSPYYHCILPLLIDADSAKIATPDIQLPENHKDCYEDAKNQLIKGINKFKEVFGREPEGVWPSEQCISPATLELMADLGIKWTVTDEGILAKTLGKEFIRDFRGDLTDPFDLSRPYKVHINDKKINVLFRNAILGDLISFEYGAHPPEEAANDFYERIKLIQSKLQASPDKNHIVIIALDGENSWESYIEDGRPFLLNLYTLLSQDESLNFTTVGDFLNKVKNPATLDTIHSGSWINRNFQLWIGDPTKNLAWDYLDRTRKDLINFEKEQNYPEDILQKAWDEMYVAQGSDWFWWYGEPNDSGQDELFDLLFRKHLQNIYILLNKPVPEYLTVPLEIFIGKPSKNPRRSFTPSINGSTDSAEEWANAGCIEIPQGAMYQADRPIRRILFGNDKKNMYFRFEIPDIQTFKQKRDNSINEIYIYFMVTEKQGSPIRLRNRRNVIFPTQRHLFSSEVEISLTQGHILPPVLSEAIDGSLWKLKPSHKINYNYNKAIELSVPLKDIGANDNEEVHFIIAISKSGILQEIIPQNKALSIRKP